MEKPKGDRRTFDCFVYGGQADLLEIRFRELWEVVDCFLLLDLSEGAFLGAEAGRRPHWNPRIRRFSRFASKVRHVPLPVLGVAGGSAYSWDAIGSALLQALPDADADDILLLSDVGEIPSAASLRVLQAQADQSLWGFRLALHALFLDYRNRKGLYSDRVWNAAARRSLLDRLSPEALRATVRRGEEGASILPDAGWRFLLPGKSGGGAERASSPAKADAGLDELTLAAVADPVSLAKRGADPFGLKGGRWSKAQLGELPEALRKDAERGGPRFAPEGALGSLKALFTRPAPHEPKAEPIVRRRPEPVVICPYLYEAEEEEVRRKFDLDGPGGKGLPFYLWRDREKIGPERAFEHCWGLFPEQDVIIVHSDMAPSPGQTAHAWYKELCAYSERLEDAGMIACDLVYPHEAGETPRLQSAGGGFSGSDIKQIYDFKLDEAPAGMDMTMARSVDWVTFGGVLILRETINACGGFDPRYQWAYYMDVDYCLEARLHGFKLYQVPVNLVHEESRTTRGLLRGDSSLEQHIHANKAKLFEKWERFDPLLPSSYFGRVMRENKHPDDAAC